MTDAERKIVERAMKLIKLLPDRYCTPLDIFAYKEIAKQTMIWEAERNLSLVQHLICTGADINKLLKERYDSLQAELESLKNG